jgi:hypothetical protein
MPSRFHVLIVEDEPLIVEVLQGALELEYRVSSATRRDKRWHSYEPRTWMWSSWTVFFQTVAVLKLLA